MHRTYVVVEKLNDLLTVKPCLFMSQSYMSKHINTLVKQLIAI